jgi:hypothetical protein
VEIDEAGGDDEPVGIDDAGAPAGRIAIVDALRGWALLGVVLVNFAIFYTLGTTTRIPVDDTTSRVAKLLTQVFFQHKGWTLLAFLFGYGFSVLIDRLRQHAHPVRRFTIRMFWLFVIALVNCALYYGDPGNEQVDASGKQLDVLRSTREHNDANALSLGLRFLTLEQAEAAVTRWLAAPFPGEARHVRRITQIDAVGRARNAG